MRRGAQRNTKRATGPVRDDYFFPGVLAVMFTISAVVRWYWGDFTDSLPWMTIVAAAILAGVAVRRWRRRNDTERHQG